MKSQKLLRIGLFGYKNITPPAYADPTLPRYGSDFIAQPLEPWVS
jgi:hypothetical protein